MPPGSLYSRRLLLLTSTQSDLLATDVRFGVSFGSTWDIAFSQKWEEQVVHREVIRQEAWESPLQSTKVCAGCTREPHGRGCPFTACELDRDPRIPKV